MDRRVKPLGKYTQVSAKIQSFRKELTLEKKFENTEERVNDLPIYDSSAGTTGKLNNLYQIKLRIDEQIRKNNNEAQKKY